MGVHHGTVRLREARGYPVIARVLPNGLWGCLGALVRGRGQDDRGHVRDRGERWLLVSRYEIVAFILSLGFRGGS